MSRTVRAPSRALTVVRTALTASRTTVRTRPRALTTARTALMTALTALTTLVTEATEHVGALFTLITGVIARVTPVGATRNGVEERSTRRETARTRLRTRSPATHFPLRIANFPLASWARHPTAPPPNRSRPGWKTTHPSGLPQESDCQGAGFIPVIGRPGLEPQVFLPVFFLGGVRPTR